MRLSADGRRLLILSVTGLLAAAACGVPAAPTRPPPVASASAGLDARCIDLQARGAGGCPPASLPTEPIAVRNGTGGAVDDATVQAMGRAYLRTHALYDWAVRQPAGDAFLLGGAIAPAEVARTNVFRTEAKAFAEARAAGGSLRVEPLTTRAITLVEVPPALRDAAGRDGLGAGGYAWVDDQAGPALVTLLGPGGPRELLRIPPGEPHPILVFGQVREDPDLGVIWYIGGEYGCLGSAQVRPVCGLKASASDV